MRPNLRPTSPRRRALVLLGCVAGLAAAATPVRAALPLLTNTQASSYAGHQLVVDGAGNAYVLAEFTAPVQCGAEVVSSPDGTQNLFVAKYNEVGDCQWIVKIAQPQVDMFVNTLDNLPRARLALTEAVTGHPDVIVGGVYLRSNSTTNLGVVTVGQTDITHAIGANASSVFLARLTQPVALPGQPAVPVQIAATSTLPANHDGYCKDHVEFTGIAVAGSAANAKMLVTLNGRGDCDNQVRAEVFESEPFQLSLANRLQPLGSGGGKHFDVVKARTTGQGAVFAIAGREGNYAFLGGYSFAAHNFSWRKIFNGGGASPEDINWGNVNDMEIAVDGLSVWATVSSFNALFVNGLPPTCQIFGPFNILIRLDAASGASFWGTPTARNISGFSGYTAVSGLAADASGRLSVVGLRFATPQTASGCVPQVTGLTAALLEPSGTLFNPAWESNAAVSFTTLGVGARGFASGGGRLFLAGGFFGSGGQISFGGGALVPSPSPLGAVEFLHRLNPLTGAWYFEEDWVAAQTIVRPPKTLAGVQPSARVPGGGAGSGDSFLHWDAPAAQLFAVHPAGTTVTLEWPTGTCSVTTTQVCGVAADCPGVESCNASVPGSPVETYGVIRWPATPQLHLAGAPATVGTGSPAFAALLYGDGGESAVVGGVFQRATAGYSVLKYAGPALQVVQSVPWENWLPAPADGGACTVGTELPVPLEHGDAPRLGYPLPGSPIDIQDVFDVTTRLGALVPVNTTTATRQMRVAWYAAGGFGRAWPTVPRTYACSWPATPAGILFPDSLMGADSCRCGGNAACLAACQSLENPAAGVESFAAATIYSENDPTHLGFNPNDEHAFIAAPNPQPPCTTQSPVPAWCTPSPSHPNGLTLFALRKQSDVAASDPYVVLKVKSSIASPWQHRVYKVDFSGIANSFTFPVTVGNKVPKPYPLSLFEDCSGTVLTDLAGTPSWQAADGTAFARADGQMSADFFYSGRVPDKFYPAGGCSRWLPDATVIYNASWPANIPTLLVGQTLASLRAGFPDLAGADAARVVFEGDKSAPSAPVLDRNLVRLFDPIATRWVAIAVNELDLFRLLKSRAPSHLGRRLVIDEVGLRLGFKGEIQQVSGSDPLLLLNVITQDERAALHAVCSAIDDSLVCIPRVNSLYALTRSPYGLPNPADQVLVGLDASGDPIQLENALGKVLSAGAAKGRGYATVAINDGIPGRQVELWPMRVDCGNVGGVDVPYPGVAFTLSGADVFGFDFGLRHGNDFGGEPENVIFDWRRFEVRDAIYSGPGSDWGTPTSPGPACPGGGALCWSASPVGTEVQLDLDGENADYLGDTYFFVRYSLPGGVCGQSTWSGDPASTPAEPVAKLAEGWVKRVVQGLNPFHQRIADFHLENGPVATYVSMVRQAGPAYEGPITFNPAADSVNDRGLIEVYETVLRRALALTVEDPGYTPAAAIDNALLLVSGRIADLSMLLGNEAWSDSIDPTIGFGTSSGDYGTLAPSIHAFQNQLPSLLAEELALLRGVDRKGTRPVYNRLTWNFTAGEGEAAYAQVYDITDEDHNGTIDAADARKLYPQGHGDAWGQYVSALSSYLRLMRHENFTWKPRVEAVNILQGSQLVDYRDERKLAAAAAARARTGAEILHLTYRNAFVEDPQGQWQGYKDPDRTRAWGVDDWARRGAQGAYFDWAVTNAVLPAVWTQPTAAERNCELVAAGVAVPSQECYQGSLTFAENGKIDRAHVPELGEIAESARTLQSDLDEADQGLNPLGLARGVVPFDIDPSFLTIGSTVQGQTHFEQIYLRAQGALQNAVRVFDHANRVTQMLRRSQDTQVDFERNVADQERDLRNRLITVFGTPYPDDGAYPLNFTGPDLLHYFYMDARDLTGLPGNGVVREGFGSSGSSSLCYTRPVDPAVTCLDLYPSEAERCAAAPPPPIPTHIENCVDAELGVVKPSTWTGSRASEGELQRIYSDHLRALAALERARLEYDDLRAEIQSKVELIEMYDGIIDDSVQILDESIEQTRSLNLQIELMSAASRAMRTIAGTARGVAAASAEFLTNDLIQDGAFSGASAILAGIRAIMLLTGEQVGFGLEMGADGSDFQVDRLSNMRDLIGLQTDRRLLWETDYPETEILVREIEALLRQEPMLALAAFDQLEAVRSTAVEYRNQLAEGMRLTEELLVLRTRAATDVQRYRYQDLTFRIARNDALQKYKAQFDLAARYVYLAAAAYDYETNLLGSSGAAGQEFFTDIVRHSSLGEVIDGEPVVGSRGLADPLGRMKANFDVLKGQLGFNNPQTETNRFSLRSELMRLRDSSTEAWQQTLREHWVDDIWQLPEFRRLARPFAPQGSQPEPALVLRFRTTVTSGLNFFGLPLGGADSTYDSSRFATKIRTVGLWFENYDATGLSNTPRVYLMPVGADVLRSPNALDFSTREWKIVDQAVPVPFPIGELDLQNPDWIPLNDSLSGPLGASRRYSRIRAYHDEGYDPNEMTTDSRLIGRSVWNSEWLLIIPGETLRGPTLADKIQGLETFIDTVSDVKVFFQTYSYPGN